MGNTGTGMVSRIAAYAPAIATLSLVTVSVAFGQDGGIDLQGMADTVGQGFADWVTIAIQVVTAIAFLIVGFGVVSKFASAVGGRAQWGEVVMPILVGAVVLIACAYFFNEATTFASDIGSAATGGATTDGN